MLNNFNYDLIKYTIPNYKLKKDKKIILIADLHGYFNNISKGINIANYIKNLNPHHIMIAGDIMQGSEWENSQSIKNFKLFLENLKEVCPIFISLGNHDLIGNTKYNHNKRVSNFKKLETSNIYPLYEDKVIYDDFEVVSISPSFNLSSNSFKYRKELLQQKYIEEINNKIEIDENYAVEFLGHDPYMILGKNLGLLAKCDYFYAGHLHNGYYPSKIIKKNPDRYLEFGFTEKNIEKDEFNHIKSIYPFIITKCDLARGVVYFNNDGNKKYLALRNNHYYKRINNKWFLCKKEEIFKSNLKALIINGGIKKFSYFSSLFDIPEITEVNYISKKDCKIKTLIK